LDGVPLPEGLGGGGIFTEMPPTALIAKQGCLKQQFGQHQPLAQILHGQQRFPLAWLQLKSQAWGLAMGQSQLPVGLTQLTASPYFVPAKGQEVALPLHPRHLPAELAQVGDLGLDRFGVSYGVLSWGRA
jgi:hypothetical protein